MESDRIDAGIDAAAGQERRQGRREAAAARAFGEVERLDAKPVARQHHAAAVPLQDREGEHAVEPLDAALAPAVVGLERSEEHTSELQSHMGIKYADFCVKKKT